MKMWLTSKYFLLILSLQCIQCQRGKQTRCKTAPTLPKKVEKVIKRCQDEVKYQLVEETLKLYANHKLQLPKEEIAEYEEQDAADLAEKIAYQNQLYHQIKLQQQVMLKQQQQLHQQLQLAYQEEQESPKQSPQPHYILKDIYPAAPQQQFTSPAIQVPQVHPTHPFHHLPQFDQSPAVPVPHFKQKQPGTTHHFLPTRKPEHEHDAPSLPTLPTHAQSAGEHYQLLPETHLNHHLRVPNPHPKIATALKVLPLKIYNLDSTPNPSNLQVFKKMLKLNVKEAKKRQARSKRRLKRSHFDTDDNQDEEEFQHLTLLSSEEKWLAGCLMQCIYRRNDAVDHHGWPTLDGLVDLYTDGVHEQKYFMHALRSVDYCLKGASRKHNVLRTKKPDEKATLCYVAFDVFDCISDKVLEYCNGSDWK